jgi:Flp pilus assembly protein protease CpaA
VICAWTDLQSRKIYNLCTYPAAAAGVAINIVTGSFDNILAGLVVFCLYLCFFLSGKMGAGDLKLAVALSLLLGLRPVLLGTLGAGLVLMAWGFAFTWHKTGQLQAALLVATGRLPGGEVPYGAVLGPAVIIAAFLT